MKYRKTIAKLLLLSFILGILPLNNVVVNRAASSYGISNPVREAGVTTWDCIYFGNYAQSDSTGVRKEPVKWRVLSVNGDDAFLLADKNLDVHCYNETSGDVTWETSGIRDWLNSVFIKGAFSLAEQRAIRNTKVVNPDNPQYGSEGGNDTQDKVYLPSIEEVMNTGYGFEAGDEESDTRVAVNTAYVAAGGSSASGEMEPEDESDFWWLRSSGDDNCFAANTDFDGSVNMFGIDVCDSNFAVRPVLHLDLSETAVWKLAGKVDSEGKVSDPVVPDPTAAPTEKPDVSLSEREQEYVNEHINYYKTSYKSDILQLGDIPEFSLLLDDMKSDLSDKAYEALDTAIKITDLSEYVSYDLDDGFSLNYPVSLKNEYSMVLYQLIANDQAYNARQREVEDTFEKNAFDLIDEITDSIQKIIGNENQKVMEAARAEFDAAKEALDKARKFGRESSEYESAWDDVEDLCKKYLDKKKSAVFFEEKVEGLGFVLDELSIVSDMFNYAVYAQAYIESSDALKEELEGLAEIAKRKSESEKLSCTRNFERPYTQIYEAITDYIKDAEKYQSDAVWAIGKKFVGANIEKFAVKKAVSWGTGRLVPGLGALNDALKIGKLGIDIFTTIDDEYKQSLMVTALSNMIRLIKESADLQGVSMSAAGTNDRPLPSVFQSDAYEIALGFDEAIHLYKTAVSLACEYGIKYQKLKLAWAERMANAPIIGTMWQKRISYCSLCLTTLNMKKMDMSGIRCHTEDDETENLVTRKPKMWETYGIACPVSVTVNDSDGKQIAYLSNDTTEIQVGYEPYFHVIELVDDEEKETGDKMKVVNLPANEGYTVQIQGQSDGNMNVFAGKVNSENLDVQDAEAYLEIPVNKGSVATLISENGRNPLGYLKVDDNVYKTITVESVELASYENAFTGSEITPVVKVRDGLAVLQEGQDYKVSYTDNVQPGIASVTVTGINGYCGSVSKEFQIVKRDEPVQITPVPTYSSEQSTNVAVNPGSLSGETKIQNKSQTQKTKTRVNKSQTYKIKSFKVKSEKPGTLTVKWKKNKKATKYCLFIKQAGASWKIKNISKKKNSLTIKKLKRGAEYKVKMRIIKNNGQDTIYGSMTKTVKARVKK